MLDICWLYSIALFVKYTKGGMLNIELCLILPTINIGNFTQLMIIKATIYILKLNKHLLRRS